MENGKQPAFATRNEMIYGQVGRGVSAEDYYENCKGLTKREYFAAKAMQGIVTGIYGGGGDNYLRQITEWSKCSSPLDNIGKALAKDAIGYADELLAQLESK